MKYIKEYKNIDFEDWDEEEINEDDYIELVDDMISVLKIDFDDNLYQPYDELLNIVDNKLKKKFINKLKYTVFYKKLTDLQFFQIHEINYIIINFTQYIIDNNRDTSKSCKSLHMDILRTFLMDISIKYTNNVIDYLPEEMWENYKKLI